MDDKLAITVTCLIAIVNYYSLLLVGAITLDYYYNHEGAPYTMTIGLGLGGPASVILAIFTSILMTWLKRKSLKTMNGLIHSFHLILIIIVVIGFIKIFFFTELPELEY